MAPCPRSSIHGPWHIDHVPGNRRRGPRTKDPSPASIPPEARFPERQVILP